MQCKVHFIHIDYENLSYDLDPKDLLDYWNNMDQYRFGSLYNIFIIF